MKQKHDIKELETLDIELYEETTFGDYTIKVEQDDLTESPREWDNLGTMVYWCKNYILGDVDGRREAISPDEFLEDHKDDIMLPLYLYDHSGITVSTTPFSCPWDSGQVGWIYVSKETIRKEFSVKRISKKMVEKIEGYLRAEVKTFDDFITGNVYYFSITREDEDGEEVDIDSCGGWFGNDDEQMFNEIKSYIKYDINKTPQQAELF